MINFFLTPITILPILIWGCAFLTRKETLAESYELSDIWKYLSPIFYILLSIPVLYICYVLTFAFYINKTDYWYNKSAKQVNFHLYKITPPNGFIVDSIYRSDYNFGKKINGAVNVAVTKPLTDQLTGSSDLIIVKQVGVGSDFDLESFINQEYPATTSAIMYSVKLFPYDISAYLRKVESKSSNLSPQTLYFKTLDNVLVSISTPVNSLEEIYFIANSFFPGKNLKPEIITQTDEAKSDVSYSPDNTKVCFTVSDQVVPVIYVSDSAGTNRTKVNIGKNCVWSPDGSRFAFLGHVTDISPIDIYIYTLSTGKTVNITEKYSQPPVIRYYDVPTWSSSTSLKVEYDQSNLKSGLTTQHSETLAVE